MKKTPEYVCVIHACSAVAKRQYTPGNGKLCHGKMSRIDLVKIPMHLFTFFLESKMTLSDRTGLGIRSNSASGSWG
jgi:hypothetical protein